MDSDLQNSHDRVTLISQRPAEDENAYADRIIAASHDCSNVFEDHKLVHYYVRGLLETSRENVIEDMRRLVEHEQCDLTSIRPLAFAQGKTVRAQSQARAKGLTPTTEAPRRCTFLKNSKQNRTSVTPTCRTSLTTKREWYPTSECATPRQHATS